MSVLSPVVLTWDGANRRIYLKSGVSDYFPIEDLYHEYRNARRTDESFRKFDALLKAEGNVSKGAGAYTPRYVVLLDGTKIIPFNESLQINQLGDIITDDPDTDPSLYDISGLTTAKPIFIKPSEAETIQLNSEAIVFSSFQGYVWVDINSPYSDEGSAVEPNGNTERSINSMTVGLEIAEKKGLDAFKIVSKTLTINENLSAGYELVGTSPFHTITVNPAADLSNCAIRNLTVVGELGGVNVLRSSALGAITNVSGYMEKCALNSTITLNGSILIMECYSAVVGSGYPVLSVQLGNEIVVRDFHGSIGLEDIVDGSHTIEIYGGRVIVGASCTGGTIHVRGEPFEIVRNDAGGCTVLNEKNSKEVKAAVDAQEATLEGIENRTKDLDAFTLSKQ